MKSIHRWAACLGLLTALGLGSSPAMGQGTAAAAEALFQQGRDEMAAGRYDSACDKFRQSDELDPAPGTKLNLADCEASRGRLATAWELFNAAEQKLDASDPRQAIAQQKRIAIEGRVPRLKLALAPGAPADTVVRIGKVTLRATAFGVPLPLDPGKQELVVTAPGRADARLNVVLEEGKTSQVAVAPGAPIQSAPLASVSASPTVPPAAPAPQEDRGPQRTKTLGYVVGGVGLAGLAVGGVAGTLTLLAKRENQDHCDQATLSCDQEGVEAARRGRLYGAITTAGLTVGVVGVGLGTYLLVKSGRSETALVTHGGPMGADFALVHRW